MGNCGAFFINEGATGGSGSVTMKGLRVGPCPACGVGYRRVPHGVYEFAGTVTRYLGKADVGSLRRLQGLLFQVASTSKGRGVNVDHLVIGPGGVFSLNAKNVKGSVWVADRTLKTEPVEAAVVGRDRPDRSTPGGTLGGTVRTVRSSPRTSAVGTDQSGALRPRDVVVASLCVGAIILLVVLMGLFPVLAY